MNNRNIFPIIISVLLLIFSCGDIFSKKQHIVGPYYLGDGEIQGKFSICFLTNNGDLIQKVPPRVVEYGYLDSTLVAKIVEKNNKESYYIINMNKDYDVSKEDQFRLGPLDPISFEQSIENQSKINWIKVE